MRNVNHVSREQYRQPCRFSDPDCTVRVHVHPHRMSRLEHTEDRLNRARIPSKRSPPDARPLQTRERLPTSQDEQTSCSDEAVERSRIDPAGSDDDYGSYQYPETSTTRQQWGCSLPTPASRGVSDGQEETLRKTDETHE